MSDDLISWKSLKANIEAIRECWATSPYVSADDIRLYAKVFNTILQCISDCPAAFDKEKVIRELKELKMMYFLTIANTGDEKMDFAYEKVGNALDKAIEIVEKGGIE